MHEAMTTDEDGRFEFEGKVFEASEEIDGCKGCCFNFTFFGCSMPDDFPDCTNRIFILKEGK